MSFHITGPLVKDETVVAFVLALPRKLVRGLVNRAALFVWWTGAWANEGDVFLRVYLCVFYKPCKIQPLLPYIYIYLGLGFKIEQPLQVQLWSKTTP